MGINVYIFGSGASAQRYYKIAEKFGCSPCLVRFSLADGEARYVERYGEQYKAVGVDSVPHNQLIILADATRNRPANLKHCLALCPKGLLVEKPIFFEQRSQFYVEKIRATCNVVTGDQYFYDDLVSKIHDSGCRALRIEYIESMDNVTKGRQDSYAQDPFGGGAKWTFSHSVFISIYLIFLKFGVEAIGQVEIFVRHDDIYNFEATIVYSDFCVEINNRFTRDDEKKFLATAMDGAFEYVDFNARSFRAKDSSVIESPFLRIDLIEQTFSELLRERDEFPFLHPQFLVGNACCDLLVRVDEHTTKSYC